VKSLEDVFTLAPKQAQLLELERWGARSTQNLLAQIERSKTPTLARFLNGIGIRHVGETHGQRPRQPLRLARTPAVVDRGATDGRRWRGRRGRRRRDSSSSAR
jgi:hypothetical protein